MCFMWKMLPSIYIYIALVNIKSYEKNFILNGIKKLQPIVKLMWYCTVIFPLFKLLIASCLMVSDNLHWITSSNLLFDTMRVKIKKIKIKAMNHKLTYKINHVLSCPYTCDTQHLWIIIIYNILKELLFNIPRILW